jgi:peroxiredoxin
MRDGWLLSHRGARCSLASALIRSAEDARDDFRAARVYSPDNWRLSGDAKLRQHTSEQERDTRVTWLAGLIALPLALGCVPAWAQATAASSPAGAATIHGFSVHADGQPLKAVYHDSDGHAISADAFMQSVKKDKRHFRIKTDPEHGRADFTLLAKGATSGGAMSISLPKPDIKTGQPLPAFTLATVAGAKATNATLKGKPTLVDFFFATCIGCIEELPAINTYAASHPGMHFLAITFDDADTAKRFVTKRRFQWPVAYAGQPLIDKLGIRAFPTLLLLDANGRLRATHVGSLPVNFKPASNASTRDTPDAATTKRTQLKWLTHWVQAHS